jgi:DNA-binding NarL/FixJ family response regulator
MSKRILLVGHCGVDGPRLKDELSSGLSSVVVDRINSDADLRQACEEGAELLLVNREPVGFDEEGLALIKQVKTDYPDCKVMLVSDYEDAQQQAVKAGAVKGFGKSEMGSPQLIQHVKQALA